MLTGLRHWDPSYGRAHVRPHLLRSYSLCSPLPHTHTVVSMEESLIAGVNCAGIPDSHSASERLQPDSGATDSFLAPCTLVSLKSSRWPQLFLSEATLTSNCSNFVLRLLLPCPAGSSRVSPEINNCQATFPPLGNTFPSLSSSQGSNNLLTLCLSESSPVSTWCCENIHLSSFPEIHPQALKLVLL